MTGLELAAFLLSRVEEDEQAAIAAGEDRWTVDEQRDNVVRPAQGFDWVGVAGARLDVPVLTAQTSNTARHLWAGRAAHIARHDPARELARCAGTRRIISRCDMVLRGRELGMFNDGQVVDAGDTLRSLALQYADHPDCRPEWLP